MSRNDPVQFLRFALRGNAGFSALSGLTLLLAGGVLEPWLGVPAIALRLVGLALLPFALGLWWNARRSEPNRSEAWVGVGLDVAWVVGSGALVLGELWPLTAAGTWTVIAVADIVLLFAALQAIGLWRSAPQLADASTR